MAQAQRAQQARSSAAEAPLPAAVVGLGLVSLFTDASSEAIFPLLPAFLAALGASNAFIGLVEGAAELVANALKYVTGLVADRRARLKPLVLAGYGLSTAARPLVAFALAPWHVLAVRLVDRVGKGVRTSPRDALIAAAAPVEIRARAFGFHRAMDHAGAALGTLLGAGVLLALGAGAGPATAAQLRTVFLWAAVPGICAMIALALTREPPRLTPPVTSAGARALVPGSPSPRGAGLGRGLPPALRRALLPMVLFGLANATDAFVLVKLARLGAAAVLAPLLWLALHVVKAATATAGGRLADRYGRRNALALGWTVYAVLWSAVGLAGSVPVLFVLAAAYGTSHGLVEGAERALVADLGGAGKGKAFGAYHLLVGLAALVSSAAFGLAWDRLGSAAAFAGSGALALVAAGALLVLVPSAPAARG
jgi:MFS family permease